MKKTFLLAAVVAALAATSVSAAEITADVSAVSNNVYRGVTLSRDGASVNGNFGVKFDNGLFANYNPSTVSFGDSTSVRHFVSGGYALNVGPVKVTTGLDTNLFTGSKGAGTPSNRNYSEAFVKAEAYGFAAEADKTINTSKLNGSKDTYYHVGYTTPAFHGLTASVGTGFTQYQVASVTRHTATDVGVSYGLTKNVKAFASYNFGGKNANGAKLENTSVFGVTAGF